MGRERTERERRAAAEFADAVRPETERFFGALLSALSDQVSRDPQALRPDPLSEEEADELALAAVHRAREEHEEDREVFGPPGAEAADIWTLNREETRETRNRTWKPPRLP